MVALPEREPLLPSAQRYSDIFARNFVAYSMQIANGMANAPKLLFINDANPVYALSKDAQVKECLAKSIIRFALRPIGTKPVRNATSFFRQPMAWNVLTMFTLHTAPEISTGHLQTVTAPRYQARPVGELILALADELGLSLGVNDIPSLLEMRANALHADFKEYLESGDTYQEAFHDFSVPTLNFMPLHSKQAKAPLSEIALHTYINSAAGNPSTGIPPYANRAITEYQLQDGLCVAQMNKATAQNSDLPTNKKPCLKRKTAVCPFLCGSMKASCLMSLLSWRDSDIPDSTDFQ